MLEKRIDMALSEDELNMVVGGMAENEDVLKRVKCSECGEIFMANPNKLPIICPNPECRHDCTNDVLGNTTTAAPAASAKSAGRQVGMGLMSGGRTGGSMMA